jgi:membrane protein
LGACLKRAFEMDAFVRVTVLAAQSFTAGIPMVIVLSALTPRSRDFPERIVHRFNLHGSTADQVRALFLAPNDGQAAITWVSVAFLIAAVMSFAATLMVVYERTLSLPHIGLRARWRAAVWMVAAAVYLGWFVELRPNVYDGGANIERALLSVLGSYVFWLFTPRILLGPRVSWRRLHPIAALTTVALALLTLASPLYMPRMISEDAARFGTIGAAFALLSWLVVVATLIVGSAVVASQVDRARGHPGGADEAPPPSAV